MTRFFLRDRSGINFLMCAKLAIVAAQLFQGALKKYSATGLLTLRGTFASSAHIMKLMPDLSRENKSFSFGLSLNCIEYIYNTIIVRGIVQNLVENRESGAAQGRPARQPFEFHS